MHFRTILKISGLFFVFNLLVSCSWSLFSEAPKNTDPLAAVRKNFEAQVNELSGNLKTYTLASSSKNSKKIVESFLNKDDLQEEIDQPFQLSFDRINDIYRRSQYWLLQFDKNLEQLKLARGEISTLLTENFLENSHEYIIMQVLRAQQDENVDKIVSEYEFLMRAYKGLENEGLSSDLEGSLRRSVVAAKFLVKLSSLEVSWRQRFPLVFSQIHESLADISTEIESDFNKYLKLEAARTFIVAKEKVLPDASDFKFNSESPIQGMSTREIDLFQRIAALEGEKIDELSNKNEILEIENNSSEFFGPDLGLNLLPSEEVNSLKCIEPSVGPEGNLSGTELPKNNWVLTLDDGPSSQYNKEFLSYLREDGIKASFFLVARKMTSLKSIVKDIDNEGHIIASHSWSHANLPKVNEAVLDHEIIDPNGVHLAILRRKPKFYRCPYGAGFKTMSIRKRILAQGMVHVLWNVDTLDWQDKNPETIVKRTLDQMVIQKRGIILFHETHPQSLEASRSLISQLKSNKDLNWLSVHVAMDLINKNRGCSGDGIRQNLF